MKQFQVGVFPFFGKRGWRFLAYTTWFDKNWKRCQLVNVLAKNGTEAKRLAIAFVKEKLNHVPFQDIDNNEYFIHSED